MSRPSDRAIAAVFYSKLAKLAAAFQGSYTASVLTFLKLIENEARELDAAQNTAGGGVDIVATVECSDAAGSWLLLHDDSQLRAGDVVNITRHISQSIEPTQEDKP